MADNLTRLPRLEKVAHHGAPPVTRRIAEVEGFVTWAIGLGLVAMLHVGLPILPRLIPGLVQ